MAVVVTVAMFCGVLALATPGTAAADTVIGGITSPSGVAITPDGSRVYVTSRDDNTVSVIDTTTNTTLGSPILVGDLPRGVAITPDGSRAYVTNSGDGTVSVINTINDTIIDTFAFGLSTPWAIAVGPDGDRAYVTNYRDSTVSVIDTASNIVVKTIQVGQNPVGIAITPDGSHAYVTNSGSGSVSVISLDVPDVAPSITGTPPAGVVGDSYLFTPVITGSPVPTVTVSSGALPAGLTLDAGTGEITGTPTTAGVFSVVLTAANGVAPGSDLIVTFLISGADVAPTISGALPPGMVGEPYTGVLTITGSPAPTVSSGALPAGLTLDPATGVLTGTPTTAGTFPFTITATNSAGSAQLPVTITVTGGGCTGSLCSGSGGSLFGS